MTRRTTLLALLLVVLLVVTLLYACRQEDDPDSPAEDQQVETTVQAPVEETADPSDSETFSHTACQANFGDGSILDAEPPPGAAAFANAGAGYFADQLLITGLPDDIDAITSGDVSLTEVVSVAFDDPELGAAVEIGLYNYAAEQGIDLFAKAIAINTQADSSNPPVFVRAEPNYILSTPQRRFDTTGAPGSPGIEGSPGSPGIEGSGAGSTISVSFDPVQFADQWAFDAVAPFDATYMDLSHATAYSDPPGIDLAIFDSSPLPSGSYYEDALCVYALLNDFGPDDPLLEGPGPRPFADNHGLFAASLAGPLANEGTIHLVQVLKADQKGALQGDLFTLLGAIDVYDLEIGVGRREKLEDLGFSAGVAHTIINLSLGFTLNPAADDIQSLLDSVRNENNTALPGYLTADHSAVIEAGISDVELPVVSLRVMLERLEAAGYVVVAAAGNDGLELSQTPAAYPDVIGVEAWHIENARACFSNRGNISAPGGGPPALEPPGDDDPNTPLDEEELATLCDVDLTTTACANGVNCDEAITGHVWSASAADGLGFWLGTSFAAPFVSGLAQSVADYGLSEGYNLTTAEVRAAVYCTANGVAPGEPSPLASAPSVGLIDPSRLQQCVDDIFAAR